MEQGSDLGSKIGQYTGAAGTAGFGLTAALGGMDMGLGAALGSTVQFLGPVIGSFFDEPAKPMYRELPSGPLLQLPTNNTQLFVPEGVSVMGERLAPQYGFQDPMGFFE